MKEFFEEFAYMCSASNTKSRGIYIFIAASLALMLLGAVVMIVMLLVNVIKFGAFSPIWAILLLLDIIIFVAVIIWLKKS